MFAKVAWLKDIRDALGNLGILSKKSSSQKIASETNDSAIQSLNASSSQSLSISDVKKQTLTYKDESESELAKTDGESYDSDISSYYTAPEHEGSEVLPAFGYKCKEILEGSEAQLDCVVGRVSPSSVAWYKDNNCVIEKEGVKISFKEETSILLLSEAHAVDSGQYTVTVFDSNKTTSKSTKVELVVKDPNKTELTYQETDSDTATEDINLPEALTVQADSESKFDKKAKKSLAELEAKKEAESIQAELEAKKEAERIQAELEAKKEAESIQAESEAKKEAERIQAELEAKKEAESIQAELEAKKEAERIQAELEAKKEAERIQAELEAKKEAERIQAELEAKKEAERIQAELEAKKEAERIQAELEAKKEAERIQAELEAKKEAERIQAELEAKKEAERIQAELEAKKEAERIQAELEAKKEAERIQAELEAKKEAERIQAELEAKKEAERIQAELESKKEAERIQAELEAKKEAERIQAELEAKKEAERIQAELEAKKEAERIQAELEAKKEAERIQAELEAKKEAERIQAELEAKKEAERIQAELESKKEAERIQAELEAKKEAERIQAELEAKKEAERIQAELEAKKEAERIQAELEAKKEAERIQAELEAKKEAERIQAELEAKKEAERIQAELEAKKESERIQAELEAKKEAERIQAELEAKKEAERIQVELEAKKEAERIQAELEAKKEAERIQAELEAKKEAERIQAELEAKKEAERIQAELEAKKEAERIQAELEAKKEAERIQAELESKKEAERIQAELEAKKEAERIQAELESKKEAERIQAELEAKKEAERIQAELEAKKEAERIQAELEAKKEAERIQAELEAKKEAERIQAELEAKKEAERNQAELEAKKEAERIQAELEAKKEAESIQAELEAKKEAERIQAELEAKKEAERIQAELEAKKEAERIQAELEAKKEAERIQAELEAKKEAERIQTEVEAKKEAESIQAELEAKKEAEKIQAELEAKKEAESIQAELEAKKEAERIQAELEAKKEAERIQAELEVKKEAERIQAELEAKKEAERIQAELEAKKEAERIQAELEAKKEAERIQAELEAKKEAERIQAELEAKREAERFQAESEAKKEAEKIQAELEAKKETERIQAELETDSIQAELVAQKEADSLKLYVNSSLGNCYSSSNLQSKPLEYSFESTVEETSVVRSLQLAGDSCIFNDSVHEHSDLFVDTVTKHQKDIVKAHKSSIFDKDVKKSPHISCTMDDCVTELGQMARFDCRVSAYPDPEITWFKDGNKVTPSAKHELVSFHDDIFSLLIKQVQEEDSGRYTCLARNEYGEAKSEALLNVLEKIEKITEGHVAPSFITKFYDIEAIEGVPVEFVCVIDGNPEPSVTWFLNGQEVESSSDILTRRQEDSVMLAFRSVQTCNSGEIICKLKNDSGEVMCKARLKVKEDLSKRGDRPLFLEQPSDTEVCEGESVTFECVISGLPEPDVTWFFNGRELHESKRRSIRHKPGQKYTLTIHEVISENGGVYTCKAVNRVGDASCAVELSVKELPFEPAKEQYTDMSFDSAKYAFPPSFTRRIQDTLSLPGRSARLEAMIIGIPEPEVEWLKDGQLVKSSPKYKIGREGHTTILVVENCENIDSGTYTCNIYNDAGKASCSAHLKVKEERSQQSVPRTFRPIISDNYRDSLSSTPRSSVAREIQLEEKIPSMPFDKPVLLDVKPNSVKLSWMPAPTAMLPDNAQRITYTIEARELPSKNWVRLDGSIDSTTYYAYNLKPEKEYMFRVKADNRFGTSEPTLPCTLRAREQPKPRESAFNEADSYARPILPKTRPYISDIGKETIQLGWKPAEIPSTHRAMSLPPISYRIEAQKLPSEEWVPLASRIKRPSFYLSDLEPDRDYNIRVRAQTPYGVSQPTEAVWIPRAKVFTGVPVTRPTITEIEEGTARLQWNRVEIPAFDNKDEPLLYMIEMQEPPSYRWRELARRVPSNYYIVRDLEPAQDYRFRVRAESHDGLLSEPSPATSVFRTLALTHSPIDRLEIEEYDPEIQSARLSWRRVEVPPYSDAENPLLYMIEYKNPQLEGWRPLVSGIPTTRYRVPDISPTDDYRFRVRALSPYGISPPSYPTGLYRHLSPLRPLAQDLYISDLEPSSIRLSWRSASVPPIKSGEPISYQIEAMEYPKREWRPIALNVQDTNYQLRGLKSSTDYSFRVRAQTPSGLADPTPPVTLTSLPVRPRLPVREPLISEIGNDYVKLQWRPAELPYYSRHTTPITYTVDYQEVPKCAWVKAVQGIPDTSYTVRGLHHDRDYRFRVRPETEYGPGEYSLPVHVHRRIAPLLPKKEPFLTKVTPSSASLSWLPASLSSGVPSKPIVYKIEGREPPSTLWYEITSRLPATSFNLQFLYPDQDYMFRVTADYDGVESEPTMSVYLPRRAGPPKMPKDAPYVSSVQPESVILVWRSVELPSRITDYSPVTYRIEIQEHPRSDWRPLERQLNQTHFHVTKLRPDLEYSFRVRAENEYGVSDPTDSVVVRKRAVPPVMPQHEPLLSDVKSDSLRLTWLPAEEPSYLTDSIPITYTVLMQEGGDTSWQPIARRVAGTSYYVTGLSPDCDYSFRVQAENNFGTSLPSFSTRLHRQTKGPIYSPEIEDVEASAFRLSWKQPPMSKKTTYSVETLEPSTWKWRPLVSRLPHPSYRITNIQPAKDYAFRVRAEVDSIISEPSLPISFSSRRALPTVPVERPTLSDIYDDSVRVNWHTTPFYGHVMKLPQSYRLEVKELPDGYWRTLVAHTDQWSYEVTDLRPNQDYAFRVRTVTQSGMSEPSLPVYLYRKAATPNFPLPPPEISDVGDDYIGLRWKLVDIPAFDVDETPLSFMIEAQRLPDYNWQPVARGLTGMSHKVAGLDPSHDYNFRLRGETSLGVTQPSPPTPLYRRPIQSGVPIANVTIDTVHPYSANLQWNPVYSHPYSTSKGLKYTIEVQEPPSNEWYLLAHDITNTSYVVPDLSPRKDYLFRIKAQKGSGEYSPPTAPIPFYRTPTSAINQIPALTYPTEEYFPLNRPYIETLILRVPPRMSIEKPTMTVITPESVRLTWKAARVPSSTASMSPTTYRVEVRHEDSFEWMEKATHISGLTTEIKGLNPHIDYAFRVRAVNDFGWSESTLPVFLHRPQDIKEIMHEIEFEQMETFGSLLGDMAPPKMPIDTPRMGIVQDRSMKLTWTPARIPLYARKTPITYLIEKKEPNDHDWITIASKIDDPSYTILNILPDQDYLFRVRAENEYGLSEATLPAALTRSKAPHFIRRSASRERELDISNSPNRKSSYSYIDSLTTGVAPRVPAGRPSISDLTETSITLSWPPGRMPSYMKGPAKVNYIIEGREPPNHIWSKINENVPTTTFKISGLNPKQDYMFRVRAFNDSGMSEPTLPVTLTREKIPEMEPRIHRRRSSVERFSSMERFTSQERSVSLERSVSVPRALPQDSSTKQEDDLGKTGDVTQSAPEFVKPESSVLHYAIDGRSVKISLQLLGNPLPTVDWYFSNKKIIYGDKYDGYVTPSGLAVLEFFPMTWSDIGDYKCVAENELGEATLIVNLQLSDPPTFLQPMKDLQLSSQGSGNFTCEIDGIPYPDVKFMKDWQPLTETTRHKVIKEGNKWILQIDDALPTDAGCYICVAENPTTKVFCTARLIVDGDIPPSCVFYKKTSIEDDYYILEEIGRGQSSIVRRVIEKSSGNEFAAKFTFVRKDTNKEFFRHELDNLLRMSSKYIEKLHDAYETQRQLILVLELVKGDDLLDLVTSDINWCEAKAAQIVQLLLQSLKDVHSSNVIHLDIEPTNVLFTGSEYNSLHLIDFGYSRKLPLSSEICFNYGTPEFCSPEVIENQPVSSATDIWAVGVITHLLLTGVIPFFGDSVTEILSQIQVCQLSLDGSLYSEFSQDAVDFISKILVLDPKSRLSLDACLNHNWFKVVSKKESKKIDTGRLKVFSEKYKENQRSKGIKTLANLVSLKQLMDIEKLPRGLHPTKNTQTGEIVLPNTEKYGEYSDQESWFDWQARNQLGPDAETSSKSISETEVVPPPLEKELRWMEEFSDPDKTEVPISVHSESKRSSVASISSEGVQGPIFTEKLHDLAFSVNDTVILRCKIAGAPSPSVVWYRNEELLNDSGRLKIKLEEDGEASLTIKNAQSYDAGVYKCVGRTKLGRVSNKMRLLIGDVPGRPGQPVVTQISSSKALIIWEAPKSVGHSDVLFYKVDYKEQKNDKWTVGIYTTQEVALVDFLKPETWYRFRVSATNRFGTGHYSWSSAEYHTKSEGSALKTTGEFFNLSKLNSAQTLIQPKMPSDIDDIAEETKIEVPTIQLIQPDNLYNIGDVIYTGKFYEEKSITLPSDNDKPFRLKTTPLKTGLNEFEILKTLKHEKLVRMFAAFTAEDKIHLVLEHAEGDHIALHLSHKRMYSEHVVASVIRQVLNGLEFLQHSNIVHLNLQPASVIVSKLEGCEVKLTDFSFAKFIPSPVGEVVPRQGYADFIPPEIIVQDLAGFAADVWGVGAIAFLLLSGVSTFGGVNDETTLVNIALNRYDAGHLYENVSSEALKFVFKVLKRLPRNRPTLQECLDHKWLQVTNFKEQETNVFLTNTLASFVQNYDKNRQDDKFQQNFDDLKLPIEMNFKNFD
ncbi:muscle M-line assembly protein unc-89-like isoform X2 [Physella acuta]|uniref:muscle M-line assembly protein unc-89-like isoform X2 n=1 Tax=Physella acuta TaxID=109671 RepID=UPI0027DB33B1|nr:muscle M-line assembly protein unc-89-like isoform X2 [Physella acuta]